MPPIPLIVPRSAFANLYRPDTGVNWGSVFCHGPNVPLVSICPFGMGLVNVAVNGICCASPSDSMRSE